ncbi:MAG: hypothetical protein HQL67_00990 [Magnetococcales bacterium]|nr:hypothetical protein [Magnetococcales bacterium]
MTDWIIDRLIQWLIREEPTPGVPLCNFSRLRKIIKPGDVVLIEGRSRSSQIIKIATQSPWSHAALALGPLNRIHNPAIRTLIKKHYDGPEHRLLILEALMDRGVVVSDLQESYGLHHLRICRPAGLSQADNESVLHFAANHLGATYDFKHLLDLARYLLPYHILPRHWGSRLYRLDKDKSQKTVCSSLLARAFMSVSFPIIPLLKRDSSGELTLFRRNFRIMTPRDFDVSPYFEIIKYPLLSANDVSDYRNLPWSSDGKVCNTDGDCFIPEEFDTLSGGTLGLSSARLGLEVLTNKVGQAMHQPPLRLSWLFKKADPSSTHDNENPAEKGER